MGSSEGIKVSIQGIDVRSAADYQLLFNSGWPTLKLYKNLNITQTIPAGSTGPIPIFQHSLGYPPAFLPFPGQNADITLGGLSAAIGKTNVACDNQNIYFIGTGNTNVVNLDIGLMVFTLDITTSYTAPNINVGNASVAHTNRDFGIKMTKDGYDVNSHDLRNFVIHSATRGPLVHAVATGPTPLSYTHTLPYTPIFLSYYQEPAATDNLYVLLNGFTGAVTSGNNITVANQGVPGNASIVVLKDPFTIDDNIINISL